MRFMKRLGLLVVVVVVAAACSNTAPPADAGGDATADSGNPPAKCTGDFDCSSAGQHCFYVIDGHCSFANVTGTCMDFVEPDACTPNVACGCDGTTISVCGPAGYVNRSSNFAGPCPIDASADAASE